MNRCIKRIFNSNHIKLMEEFLSSNLPSVIRTDTSLTVQATKLLLLMDTDQLRLLTSHFDLDRLTEEQVDQQLRSLGFLSKINLFEKKAMIADISKRRLIKTITENYRMLNSEDIHKGVNDNADLVGGHTGTGLVYNLLRQLFNYKLTTATRQRANNCYEPEFEMMERRPPAHLGVNTGTALDGHLPEGAPAQARVKRTKSAPPRAGTKPKQGPVELDMAADPSVVLRRKKALYYEPSGPIDYHTGERHELKSIKRELRLWKWKGHCEEEGSEFNLYEEFDLRSFVDEVVFTNNGLAVPTESKYGTIEEFRARASGIYVFRKKFLPYELTGLILRQDESLTRADAELIAMHIRQYLTLAELEYFYRIYLDSNSFRLDKQLVS